MGQTESEKLEEESFELQVHGVQKCQITALRLRREVSDLERKAKLLVRNRSTSRHRIESLLREIARKEKQADDWENRASQLENVKHRITESGIEADAAKAFVRISRIVKKPIINPLDVDRELAMFDDNLAGYGAAGRDVMQSNEGDEIDVSARLRELQDEEAVQHDLPWVASSAFPGMTTPLRSSGGRVR
jgi:hypothetical protein